MSHEPESGAPPEALAAERSTKESLAERADRLPVTAGVYLFKSARGKVLYVGKAQNLRARVKQYVGGGDGRLRIPSLMRQAVDVDVFVTPTVKDALLLENEFIKRYRPSFNVKLRDDKQYLALRLDPREEWPRLREVRSFKQDGAQYFGPYTSSIAMKGATSNLRRIFPLRSCTEGTFKDYARRKRPCIEFEMKRCLGPCCGLVEPEAYAELVHGTALFLRGRSDELVRELGARMQRAAESEDFEGAARLRDRIEAVERTVERQQIVGEKPIDRDVFGLARAGGEVEVQVLHVREGRVVGADGYPFSDVQLDDGEVMGSFVTQYYGGGSQEGEGARRAPPEVLTAEDVEDVAAIASWLRERAGRKVELRRPQRGPGRELTELATRNAQLALLRRIEARESVDLAIAEVRERCNLAKSPRRIECYDVSTLHGTLAVASRVCFVDGRPEKASYRRYRIRDARGGDDYGCLREVIGRRLARVESEPLPDLLMVDGGRGQVAVAAAALQDAELTVDLLGLSKEREEADPLSGRSAPRVRRSGGLKAEQVHLPGRVNPVKLRSSSKGLLLLQRVRDESHRFAIEFQRELRLKTAMTSILEELPGIGPKKRRNLLRHVGSLEAVRAASAAELTSVPGISPRDAETISAFFAAVREAAPAKVEQGTGDPSADSE